MSDDWRTRAACRGADPELWFPDRGDHATITAALAVCAECPVRPECLDESLRLPASTTGIWGGETDRGRRRIRRQRAHEAITGVPYQPTDPDTSAHPIQLSLPTRRTA